VLVTATDEFKQQIGMEIEIGEIADLVDHPKTGAGIGKGKRPSRTATGRGS
jgi:hypothetical protein